MQKVEQQIRRAIAKKLREDREAQGLMQKDMAARMNVPHSRICEWEQGKTTIAVLYKYGAALGKKISMNVRINLSER